MTRRTPILALCLWAAVAPATADARTCAPHKDIVAGLAERYGETRQSIGLAANNAVVELFASDQTGSWTLTMTVPGGLTCLIASGSNFEQMAGDAPKPGSPA